MTLFAREILETCLYVDDLAHARQFYTGVLGLAVVDEHPGRHLFLRCGQRMLLLFIPAACEVDDGSFPPHGAHGAGHVAFAAFANEYDAWRTHLEAHAVAIEREITWPHGPRSLYFRDPAGNSLEVTVPALWQLNEQRTISSP
jgi:catechol 2,3-dioxygenase-like lactoylglutathione lyase family enzyme